MNAARTAGPPAPAPGRGALKRTLDDLALFGGRAAFLRPLSVGTPNPVDRVRLYERLDWALDNQWLSNGGPLCAEFEARVADLAGTRHAVATCNATSALHLLVRAAGLTGEVIMPSLTFAATAHAVQWLGLTPVFCDVDPRTGLIDPDLARAAVTPRTSAVIGVHLWGRPCDTTALEKLAADHGLHLFLDAAHALGCTHGGVPVGAAGAAEVFSFHATKVVGAFEGGAIVTDDDALAARVRALANFGKGLDEVSQAGGTNAKMSEAAAAMGLTSLDALPAYVEANQACQRGYRDGLARIPGLTLRLPDDTERHNHQYTVLEVDEHVTGLGRDLLMELLRAENALVLPPIGSPPCHLLEPYRSRQAYALPHTEALAARTISLPTGPGVGPESVRRLCETIRFAVAHGAELTARHRRTDRKGPA
ncbi:aminotransferase class I/II-fold pyridoxal phosphate-dependent enzyme [Streptomyces sp. RerS4]|uniref:aminotransferase class I/II-fold pyridoxal phosphate-dependent enzyme n=1 Tax=Streptomyces sp. RerS4 TaxID=2942449 RepID=UPI00201C6D97|nr:aminotransferase class I/II-fold pyridoxal phosphate-dependent enzyme [Streptomyces sp. RerS4]UQX05404.1 aminotransferase class I/II-fold pyridoxal phosphate-dependent enzyme [Streptomyces sp. RerS4]